MCKAIVPSENPEQEKCVKLLSERPDFPAADERRTWTRRMEIDCNVPNAAIPTEAGEGY